MKFLLEKVSEYFDEYADELNKSWLNEFERVKDARTKGEKEKFDIAKVMRNQPQINISKFTGMFTEASERIDASYRVNKQKPKGLFGKIKEEK